MLIFNFKVYNLGTDEMTGIPYYYSVAVVKIRDNSSELIYLKVSLFFLYPSEEFKIILSLIYLKVSHFFYPSEEFKIIISPRGGTAVTQAWVRQRAGSFPCNAQFLSLRA